MNHQEWVSDLIESYEFGAIVIDGKKYTSDIIVSSKDVNDSWWRKEGHKLQVEDLTEIFKHETKPDVIVLGTGYYGLVKITSEVEDLLKSSGIEIIPQPTSQAVQTYNRLLQNNSLANERKRVVVGAFHLTC